MSKILSSVLIKPAGPDCNLACDYCFYLEKADYFHEHKVHRMSDDILKEMVKQIMWQGGQNLSFGWQGGEPTLMGVEFFEKAIKYQSLYGRQGQIVGNGLQTNGVLIDEKWAEFLYENKFLVGLSLDGPQHIHDKYRKFPSGKSSWERVTKARDLLLEKQVEVNALVVVNDYSVKHVQEIYDYHKNTGLHYMQFIPCVEPDPVNPQQAAGYSVNAQDFGQFLCDIFDLWQNDFVDGLPTTHVRWFDSVFYTYVGMNAPECTLLEECGIYTVIEHNGDVYSCDFYVDSDWKLGNIKEDSLDELLNSPLQTKFGKVKKAMPQECYSCKWLSHCYGGCPKDRQSDPMDNGCNHFCESYKMFFNYADGRLTKMADEWKNANRPEKTKSIGRNDPCPCGSGKKYKKCCG